MNELDYSDYPLYLESVGNVVSDSAEYFDVDFLLLLVSYCIAIDVVSIRKSAAWVLYLVVREIQLSLSQVERVRSIFYYVDDNFAQLSASPSALFFNLSEALALISAKVNFSGLFEDARMVGFCLKFYYLPSEFQVRSVFRFLAQCDAVDLCLLAFEQPACLQGTCAAIDAFNYLNEVEIEFDRIEGLVGRFVNTNEQVNAVINKHWAWHVEK